MVLQQKNWCDDAHQAGLDRISGEGIKVAGNMLLAQQQARKRGAYGGPTIAVDNSEVCTT